MGKNKEKNESLKEVIKLSSQLITQIFEKNEREKDYLKEKLQKCQLRYFETRMYISQLMFRLFDDIQEKEISNKEILKNLMGIISKI